jgi:hypothetical protein
MSENITHTGVLEDTARIVAWSSEICDEVKDSLDRHLDIARLGGITRSGDKHTSKLLGRIRGGWPGDEADRLPEKLAFVCGWLCHRATDRQMKPIFRATDPDCLLSPTDCSVYHDVFVLQKVFGAGEVDPYSPMVFKPELPRVQEAFQSMWQRYLVALHTFIPDDEDAEGWMARLFDTVQGVRVDLDRYAEAFESPDPDKMDRFIWSVSFYEDKDPLIAAARSLQNGEKPETELQDALESAKTDSHYAQAVARSYGYLHAASEFMAGKLRKEKLEEALEIGVPGG